MLGGFEPRTSQNAKQRKLILPNNLVGSIRQYVKKEQRRSSGTKGALKMMVKLSTSVNFINVLCERFSYKILAPKITKLFCSFETFGRQHFVQKIIE